MLLAEAHAAFGGAQTERGSLPGVLLLVLACRAKAMRRSKNLGYRCSAKVCMIPAGPVLMGGRHHEVCRRCSEILTTGWLLAARLAAGLTPEDAPVEIPEARGFTCHADVRSGCPMAVNCPSFEGGCCKRPTTSMQ